MPNLQLLRFIGLTQLKCSSQPPLFSTNHQFESPSSREVRVVGLQYIPLTVNAHRFSSFIAKYVVAPTLISRTRFSRRATRVVAVRVPNEAGPEVLADVVKFVAEVGTGVPVNHAPHVIGIATVKLIESVFTAIEGKHGRAHLLFHRSCVSVRLCRPRHKGKSPNSAQVLRHSFRALPTASGRERRTTTTSFARTPQWFTATPWRTLGRCRRTGTPCPKK